MVVATVLVHHGGISRNSSTRRHLNGVIRVRDRRGEWRWSQVPDGGVRGEALDHLVSLEGKNIIKSNGKRGNVYDIGFFIF
jgi:hypothetical protein